MVTFLSFHLQTRKSLKKQTHKRLYSVVYRVRQLGIGGLMERDLNGLIIS